MRASPPGVPISARRLILQVRYCESKFQAIKNPAGETGFFIFRPSRQVIVKRQCVTTHPNKYTQHQQAM